ncbi:hypothetical protein [Halorarum halobium]|uniref:hypothetical protein n=1 Tax=Halorarum halobium TaxID=3075121 RepID=UPI0028A8D5E7|nr:hypothetical protein [Halobaculum sp. XH14]
MKYCLDCEWSSRDSADRTGTDSSERAIDHARETGHSISSDDSPSLPPIRAEIGPGLMFAFRALTGIEESRRDP